MISGAAAGAAVTVLTHREPGTLLGVFVIVTTVAAALATRPRAARLVIPVPALAYGVAAVMAGLIRDRAAVTTRTELAVSAVQWIASGFLTMTTATVLAIAITAARWRRPPRRPRRPKQPPQRPLPVRLRPG